jgi:uncharacterized membrane protein
MALSLINRFGPILERAGCFFCVVLCLLIVFVLTDIWRIERRQNKPIECVLIGFLAASVLVVGVIFGRCAITGCYPSPPIGGCR